MPSKRTVKHICGIYLTVRSLTPVIFLILYLYARTGARRNMSFLMSTEMWHLMVAPPLHRSWIGLIGYQSLSAPQPIVMEFAMSTIPAPHSLPDSEDQYPEAPRLEVYLSGNYFLGCSTSSDFQSSDILKCSPSPLLHTLAMSILARPDMITPAILSVLFSFTFFVWYSAKKRLSYPPGPKRLPIVGNLFSMPSHEEWVTYRKWSDQFGSDIIHTDVMGSHIIILNSIKVAHDLLDKRSPIYSDRPPMAAVRDLLKMDFNIGFLPYGPTWRHLRREFHVNFVSTELEVSRPLEQRAVYRLLRNLLSSPDDFSKHLRHMAGQIILSAAYGIDVRPDGDPYVEEAEKVLHALMLGSTKEATLFDSITWLIYMPSWFPGAGFKRTARKWGLIVDNALQTTYDKVKGDLASGTAAPSVSANMISKLGENPTELELLAVKGVPGTMYMAGADTTVTALEIFILAMTLYPEVQRKAQAEIDRVVGNLRLPDYSDQDELPYVQAVLKEVLRWHPVTPLSVPHRVTKSDVYEGHFIPAGSIVIPNVWGMLHDPNIFTEPGRFNPERWFSLKEPEFPNQAFGFGARLCPGRFFARRSMWSNMAGILAAFDIVPTEDGPPEGIYSSGIVSYVKPFRCYIRPRSEAAASLIRDTESEV